MRMVAANLRRARDGRGQCASAVQTTRMCKFLRTRRAWLGLRGICSNARALRCHREIGSVASSLRATIWRPARSNARAYAARQLTPRLSFWYRRNKSLLRCGGSQLVKCADNLQRDAVDVCKIAFFLVPEDEIKEARRGFGQHKVKRREAGLVSDAKIGPEYDDRLLSICISAFPGGAGIGIGPVHIGDDYLSPINTLHVLFENLPSGHGPLLGFLRQPHFVPCRSQPISQ